MSSNLKALSDQEIIDLLIAKHANLDCPVCKHDAVTLVEKSSKEQISQLQLFRMVRDYPMHVGGVRTVSLACARCGFIRQFVLELLASEKVPSQ